MSRNHKNVAYLMFVVVLALAALDQTILGTALPVIARELRGDSQVSWVFSAYLIASTVVIPLYGKAADAYGSKPMLLTAISLFFVGSLACGFSANMSQLIISRGIQGAGAGGLMTLTMLGVLEMYPPDARGKYQALLAASYGISTMFGPLLGGLLVENLSWQWAFFINLPGALLALVILAIYFQGEAVREAQRVDLIGAAMLAAALIVGLLATGHDSGVAETVGGQWILILGAITLFVTFVVIQLHTRNPVLPISLFSNPVFTAAAGISAVSGVALFTGVVFLPIYLQTALMQTPVSSAWHLLPLMFGITLSAIAGGKILRAAGPARRLAMTGGLLMTLSFCAVALVFKFSPANALLLSGTTFPLGLGIGLIIPLVTMVSQRSAPPQHLGIGTATPIMIRALGGAFGVAVLGSFLTGEMAKRLAGQGHGLDEMVKPGRGHDVGLSHQVFANAFAGAAEHMFWIVAAVCVLALVGAWVLPTRLSGAAPQVARPSRVGPTLQVAEPPR